MNLPNPIIRSHYANGFIKQYDRDHHILRTEPASNNVNDYGISKAVANLPALRKRLSEITDNYLTVQQDILETFIDRGQLRKLTQPTITATGKRIPGLKLDNPRQLAVMHALVRFAHNAAGGTFAPAEIHPHVIDALGSSPRTLHPCLAPLRPLSMPRSLRAFSAPSEAMLACRPNTDPSSIAFINALSTISTRSSARSALKLHESNPQNANKIPVFSSITV
jgi:hypothetical protein